VVFVRPVLAPKHAHARVPFVAFALLGLLCGARSFEVFKQTDAQKGTPPCGACGARAGAQTRPRTCGCFLAVLDLTPEPYGICF